MAKIPKKIWLTYKTKELQGRAKECYESWKTMNPDYEVTLMDDDEIDSFIKDNFPESHYRAFKIVPLGVMRADFWRYCIIYVEGGIYSDVDCYCKKPFEQLLNRYPEAEMILDQENTSDYCNWCFCGTKGNSLLKTVIDFMVNRILCNVSNGRLVLHNEHFVHYYTGPSMFTEAIHKHIGFPGRDSKDGKGWIKPPIVLAQGMLVTYDENNTSHAGEYIEHWFGGDCFNDGWYCGWKKEKDILYECRKTE